jgi:hypothetical protein
MTAGRKATAGWAALLLCAMLAAPGCGSDDDGENMGGGSTATPTPSPTVSPTPEEPPHTENLFGSTAEGSGALTVDAKSEVEVFFSACLGGTGPTCDNGTVVYTGTDPGFEEAEEDEPDEPLFVLVDGTPVSLQVTAIEPGVSLKFDDVTLNAVGQSVLLGTTPGVHRDLEWTLSAAGGEGVPEGRSVSLKMTTTSSTYTESAEFTVTLQPTGAPPD